MFNVTIAHHDGLPCLLSWRNWRRRAYDPIDPGTRHCDRLAAVSGPGRHVRLAGPCTQFQLQISKSTGATGQALSGRTIDLKKLDLSGFTAIDAIYQSLFR